MRKTLTSQQQRVLDFVVEHCDRNGFPPTLREIGQGIGLGNVNAVRGHLAALEKKGYIARTADKARSIRIVGQAPPSRWSRLRRRLHDLARTDKGVLHRVVYGMAWKTRQQKPLLTGRRAAWVEEALDRECLEHGWNLLEKRVRPDHVVLVVLVWPNHSPRQVVRRFRAAGAALRRKHPQQPLPARLWDEGFLVTTDLAGLDDLVEAFLAGADQAES